MCLDKVEASNDNGDPFVIDWNGVNTGILDQDGGAGGTAVGPGLATLLQDAQSRGVKIIGSIWSPPAWMKTSELI